MLVGKATVRLLWHLLGLKGTTVHEITVGVDGLVLVFSLVRNVLARIEFDLHRVQLLAQKGREERKVRGDGDVQVVELQGFQPVKIPSKLKVNSVELL